MTPRRIVSPIFGRDAVPGGRQQDVAALLPADERARHMWRPAGRGIFAGWYLYRFPSVDTARAEKEQDGARCPEHMGGGTRGYGPAAIGWQTVEGGVK